MAAVNLPLNQYSDLPEGFLDTPAERLADILPGPALIHLPGRQERPLFVSVLLHGNETTGLHAVQALLRKHAGRTLPRALSLFIGNVAAAAEGLRRLDGQPDYNRVWPGTAQAPCPERALLAEVTETMARREVFASVDVHNNTGLNPHYGCVTQLDHQHFWLASMFSRLVIYFTHPRGTQAAAFGALCPAVTLECGKPEHAHGAEHAFEYLDACLHLSEIPSHPVPPQDLDLYHEVAQVMVREGVRFGFGREGLDLRLNEDIDHFNFTRLAAGTVLGEVSPDFQGLPLRAMTGHGRDGTEDYFAVEDGRLLLRKAVMPSMLTLDERVIGQDCLCYLMERAALD